MKIPDARLRALDQRLGNLEAVTRYPAAVAELEKLRAENAALKEQAVRQEKGFSDARLAVKGLQSQVTVLTTAVQAAETRAAEAGRRAAALEQELTNLRSFAGLFKGAEGMTLEEARAAFMKAEEEEVAQRAGEMFEREAPSRTEARLREILRSENWPSDIAAAVRSEAQKLTELTLRNPLTWPSWFQALRDEDVRKRVSESLNTEFERRVAAGVESKFKVLEDGRWAMLVKSKADSICASLRRTLTDLQGDFSFSCDQCGTLVVVPIGLQEVVTLMKVDGALRFTCPNPICLDREAGLKGLFGSTKPHELPPITLEDLAIAYVGRNEPPDSVVSL